MNYCTCGHFNCLVCAANRVGYHAPTWFNAQSFHQHEPAAKPAEPPQWRSYSSHDGTRWRYFAQHVETGEVVETDEIGVPLSD